MLERIAHVASPVFYKYAHKANSEVAMNSNLDKHSYELIIVNPSVSRRYIATEFIKQIASTFTHLQIAVIADELSKQTVAELQKVENIWILDNTYSFHSIKEILRRNIRERI